VTGSAFMDASLLACYRAASADKVLDSLPGPFG